MDESQSGIFSLEMFRYDYEPVGFRSVKPCGMVRDIARYAQVLKSFCCLLLMKSSDNSDRCV